MPDEPTSIDADDFDVAFEAPDPAKPNGKEKAKAKPKGNGHDTNGIDPDATGLGDRWLDACQTNARSEPRANVVNAELALRNDPAWVDLAFDEMLQAPVFRAVGKPLQDHDVDKILSWMQKRGLQTMGDVALRKAIGIVARERGFHPIREKLEALENDGSNLLPDWLHRFVGAPDDEYHRQVSTLFLAQMVARVFEPGCKADYTLVLEGAQRQLKSSFCAALVWDERYFSENLPDIGADKEVAAHLVGKWLIEIAELSAFQRADNERLKTFLTRRNERYRPAYGHEQVEQPRQCVFVATTNKFVWMKDETGGTRFWPVRCVKIDLAGFRAALPQLLAEARDFYRLGRWWPLPEDEAKFFAPQQNQRYEGDAWQQLVQDWDWKYWNYDSSPPIKEDLPQPFYLADIALNALKITPDRFGVREQRRLVAILEYLGWTREPRTNRGIPWRPV